MRDPSAYLGAEVVFATRHGKERQVAGVFACLLGSVVTAPPDLDTDRFGTFTGDVARCLPPLETALAKARLGLAETGLRQALASEGSYGSLPGLGWPGHEEILLFLDDARGWYIIEGHRGVAIPGVARTVAGLDELRPHLPALGWPGQALVVRPHATGAAASDPVVKGVTDLGELAAAIHRAGLRSPDGRATVEPDLRAMHNPTRRAVLRRLGRRMALRLATRCPACATPGYGRTGFEAGLPCADCGRPTELPRADVHTCPACRHTTTVPRGERAASPGECPDCNP
ncbi:DUF6671 family protein [Dactylosporangium matsuzakiense]|uniref:DUF6671 domain-containing protein n=1 Tax=Dactylosporangium matsuzakiense TaxID=53360 RepID=A0A9W6KUG7_9ACTN|nr:DUF6671 family protein [Dactylosporangium matsuzakiense]UWZ41353.1 hypothetical protein Dmats_27165 [Dactylosporangium matsuzakiense]GLL08282.1 hypothetical protein GCM10017581_100430 [Dactylosporangium matsuzakiense]